MRTMAAGSKAKSRLDVLYLLALEVDRAISVLRRMKNCLFNVGSRGGEQTKELYDYCARFVF